MHCMWSRVHELSCLLRQQNLKKKVTEQEIIIITVIAPSLSLSLPTSLLIFMILPCTQLNHVE